MFPELLKTEFLANRFLMLLGLLLNVFFILLMGVFDDRAVDVFIGATSIVFYIHVIVMVVSHSDQKITRLYAQLPVTTQQIFWASWLVILTWLAAQTIIWFAYGLWFDAEFEAAQISLLLQRALGVLVFLAVISIAFDLWGCRPRLWFWLYVAFLAGLISLPIIFDVNSDRSGQTLSDLLLATFSMSTGTGLAVLSVLFVGLLLADLAVFKRNDSYLY